MGLPTVPELAAMIDHAVLKSTQTERDVVDRMDGRPTRAHRIRLRQAVLRSGDRASLRQIVGPKIGVKASSGIRTLDDALAMIEAAANRLGTSATAVILGELRRRRGEV